MLKLLISLFLLFVCDTSCHQETPLPLRSLEFVPSKIKEEIVKRRQSYPLETIQEENSTDEKQDQHASYSDLSVLGGEEEDEPSKANSLRSPSLVNLLAGLSAEDIETIRARQAAFDAQQDEDTVSVKSFSTDSLSQKDHTKKEQPQNKKSSCCSIF